MYPSLCRKAVQALGRLDLGSAGVVLTVDASVRVADAQGRADGRYATLQPFAIALLILYAFGIPLSIYVVMRRCKTRLGKAHWGRRLSISYVQFESVFGFLFREYRFLYWELTEALRKFIIVAIPIVLGLGAGMSSSVQLIMAQTVTAVYAIATAWFQPYKETTETVLQLQVRHAQL